MFNDYAIVPFSLCYIYLDALSVFSIPSNESYIYYFKWYYQRVTCKQGNVWCQNVENGNWSEIF